MMSTTCLQRPDKLMGIKLFSKCNMSLRHDVLLCVDCDMGDAYCPDKSLGGF